MLRSADIFFGFERLRTVPLTLWPAQEATETVLNRVIREVIG
jgi:hypothetical protein